MKDNEMFEKEFEDRSHISEYIDIIYKRKITILVIFFLVVSLTLYKTYRATPIYQASTTMIIDNEKSSSPITGQRMAYESFFSQTMTFNTHFKLITSDDVLRRVIAKLKLDEPEESDVADLEINSLSQMLRAWKNNINLLLSRNTGVAATSEDIENSLIRQVKAKVNIQDVEETRLLKILVKDKDPKQAAVISNTLAEQYIQFNMANQMDASRNSLDWMNNELYHLRKKLEDAERAFFAFKQQNKVFSIEGQQKMVDQKLSEFNTNYLAARNRGLELDSRINEIEKAFKEHRDLARVRTLINNPNLESVYAKIKDLEIERGKLAKVFKGKHPKMIQVTDALAKNRTRLDRELEKELSSLRSQRTVMASKEAVLKETLQEFEQDALDTSSNELEYSILQRNLNTSKALYDALLAKIKESDLLKTSDTSNIRIVETASIPRTPVSPNKKRNILLGVILGLMGGVFAAFFQEYMDQTIRTEEDVEKYIGLNVLSIVPVADNESKGK